MRKRLREVAEFHHGSGPGSFANGTGGWEWKAGLPMETGAQLEAKCTPEQICGLEAMFAAQQRLEDMGYAIDIKKVSKQDLSAFESEHEIMAADELRMAPWRVSRDFIDCVNKKCLLYISGPADPTGCKEGFAYLRLPVCAPQYVCLRDQVAFGRFCLTLAHS